MSRTKLAMDDYYTGISNDDDYFYYNQVERQERIKCN